MIFEPFPEFLPSEYRIKFATESWERREAAALRRLVFCDEQKISQSLPSPRSPSRRKKSLARSVSTRRSREFGGARGSLLQRGIGEFQRSARR